jgi:hypothetical protein
MGNRLRSALANPFANGRVKWDAGLSSISPLRRIEQAKIFWHLDVYPTRPEAEKAKGPRGTVVESLGKVRLLTIEKAGWRPAPKGTDTAKESRIRMKVTNLIWRINAEFEVPYKTEFPLLNLAP